MTDTDQRDTEIRGTADLLTAIVLVVLGLAIFYFSSTMDRLEVRRIHPLTIPGLVPMALSAALVLCGALLCVRSLRLASGDGWRGLLGVLGSAMALRVWTVLILAFTYTLVLVGLLPFWAASAVFVFAFIMLFESVLSEERKPALPVLAWALGIALVAGIAIHYVFERIFLVRLP
jgi:putative tricarboxylic transport membrane protein